MSNYLDGDLLLPSDISDGGVIRAERVWQHCHEIDLADFRSRSFRRWAFTGWVMASLACACLYAQPVSNSAMTLDEAPVAPAKTVVAADGIAKLQKVVDVAPAFDKEFKAELATLPVLVTPTRRPVSAAINAGGKPDTRTEMSVDVVRFYQCMPQCGSHDPLIAIPRPTGQKGVAVHLERRAEERETVSSTAFDGARYVLVQTAMAPITALRFGRDAVGRIADLY